MASEGAMRKAPPPPKRRAEWSPNLEDFGRHSHFKDCLAIVWSNAGAAGKDPQQLLLPYQWSIFRDLEDGLDEHALSKLYDWWEYDLETLFERGRQWRRDLPAKPRIRLYMEVSRKGNFKVEWWPVGCDNEGNPEGNDKPDWRYWYRAENRSAGWDSRPSNELLFIHDVDHAFGTIRELRTNPRPIELVDHVLLQGIAGLVSDLKARLDSHFEVVMLRDLFVTWKPDEWSWGGEDRITKWEIDDPQRRENEKELAELGSVQARLGFTEDHFEELWARCLQKKRSGPAPSARTEQLAPKVAKALREEGLKDITAHDTKRVRYLIDKHRIRKIGARSAEVIQLRPSSS
jgi:hypothetical protein